MEHPTVTKIHSLGWLPDLPDQRDHIFSPEKTFGVALAPAKVDLRAQCPGIYDQGQLGSCTSNALAAAFDFDRKKEGHAFMTPSRLFIYWNERNMEGTVNSDAGARIRDGVKSLKKLGVAPEKEWPYEIAKFTVKPSAKCYTDALKNQMLSYQRIVTPHNDPTHDMLACLAGGYPFVAGISVYESFESAAAAKTGVIPMPGKDEQLLGGHAILVIGYDTAKKEFMCRNSWGTSWGDGGHFYLPFGYLTSHGLASDMWLVKTVEV